MRNIGKYRKGDLFHPRRLKMGVESELRGNELGMCGEN